MRMFVPGATLIGQIANENLAPMPARTVKGNPTSGSAEPTDMPLVVDVTLDGVDHNSVPSSLAIKTFVEQRDLGMAWKPPVSYAASTNRALTGEQTIDGGLTNLSRVILLNQSDPTENGIWVTAPGAWARATDMDDDADFPGATVRVVAGATLNDRAYTCNNASVTVGVTNIVFVQSFGPGLYSADETSLTQSGTVFSVKDRGVTPAKLFEASAQYNLVFRSTAGAGSFEQLTTSADFATFAASANFSGMRSALGLGSFALLNSLAASGVTNTPAGGIAATDVQAALNELDTEKASLTGATFTGTITVTGAGVTLTDGDFNATKDASRAQLALNTYYSITSGSSRLIQRRARGTAASPTAVLTNDYLGNILIQGYGASTFVTGAEVRFRAIAATPSNTDMESDVYFATCAAGASTPTPVLVFAHSTGIQFGGVSSTNTILDANRLHIMREFTVATLPVAPLAGATAVVTDATAPVKGSALVGGGAVVTGAIYSGGAWRAI